jgi:S1-C subfamily serine protease
MHQSLTLLESLSSGSGFIVTESGRLVTNCHVVQFCQSAPIITLDNNQQFKAHVVGVDKDTDLALLQIIRPKDLQASRIVVEECRLVDYALQEPFPIAKLGDSDHLKPGMFVMALVRRWDVD